MAATPSNAIDVTTSGAISFNGTAFTGGTLSIANGGTNATSFTQSAGIVVYDGTRLVNYAGPQIDTSGRMTNTSQPSFFAYLATTDANATGNGATYTLGGGNALTVSFDRNSNFNTNGTFTAPVTGIYHFSGSIMLSNIVAGTAANFNLVAGGITYRLATYTPLGTKNVGSGNVNFVGSSTIALTATNTATLQMNVTGESGNTESVIGSTTRVSFFSGFLVC